MGHGYGAYQKRVRKELKSAEDSIRGLFYERLIVINVKGERVVEHTGNQDGISVPDSDAGKLANAIVTHNHPTGGTFSPKDLETAFDYGVRELRVCHNGGYYSLERTFAYGKAAPHYRRFSSDYKAALQEYDKKRRAQYNALKVKTPAAKQAYRNDINSFARGWLKQNAEKYGWYYTEGK